MNDKPDLEVPDVKLEDIGTDQDLPEGVPDPLEVAAAQPYEGSEDEGAVAGDPRLLYVVGQGGDQLDDSQPAVSRFLASVSGVRTGQEALNWAESQHLHRTRSWYRDCLLFVRESFNVGSYYGRAEWAYYGAQYKHTTWPPPAAVPVWWTNGSFGHVAISAGHGYCWSSDFLRYGYIDKVRIASITAGWGQSWRGWSEDINRTRVYHADWWTLNISSTILAARHKTELPNGDKLKHAVALEVGQGRMGPNRTLGVGFREQYRKLQVKYLRATGQVVTSTSADGIPGRGSLTWLGARHGFNVA